MKNILKAARAKNSVISIHEDIDDVLLVSTGFVKKVNKNLLILESISPEGIPSGDKIIKLQEIILIDIEGIYETKLKKLYEGYLKDIIYIKYTLLYKTDNYILETLQISKSKKLVITIWINNQEETLSGIVEEIQKDKVILSIIDSYGYFFSKTIFYYKYITRLEINSKENQVKKYLYLSKKK